MMIHKNIDVMERIDLKNGNSIVLDSDGLRCYCIDQNGNVLWEPQEVYSQVTGITYIDEDQFYGYCGGSGHLFRYSTETGKALDKGVFTK